MSKSTVFLALLLAAGFYLLGTRFFADAPAPVAAPVTAAPAEPAPAPVAKVKAPKPVANAVKPIGKTEDDAARQEAKAKVKAFMEETKKMAEEIAGGDPVKLQRAVMSGMMKPENQALMKEMREFGAAMRNATPEEREVLGQQAVALRDRAMAALRAEVAAPAPVIIM
jgi:3-oxoacyl-ACP reductase-like protein